MPLQPLVFKRTRSLRRFLTRQKISFSQWGVGTAKNFLQLWEEYQAGETVFTITKNKCTRWVRRVHPRIYVYINGVWLRLVEDRHEFHNGAIKYPSRSRSLSEKMLPYETPEAALARGIFEELGITSLDHWIIIPVRVIRRKRSLSKSYPGLPSRHTDYKYICIMPAKDFRPEGYIEKKSNRDAYFVWQKTGWKK